MTAPVGPFYPTNQLVAEAWLATRVPELNASMVAGMLPSDKTKWSDQGFVQARSVVGGTPNVDIPIRRPLIQVDFWACTIGSAKPPWRLANRLAECVRVATESPSALYGKPVLMPSGYKSAIVLTAYLINEPRQIFDDPSGYARLTADLMLDWVLA